MLDPVCGIVVRDQDAAPRAGVGGQEFAFCSEACKRAFTAPQRERAWMLRRAALALGGGVVLALLPRLGLVGEPALGWSLLTLGTLVQVVAGAPFYAGLRDAVRQRASNMATLVVLGTTAAWLFGAIEVLAPEMLVPGRQVYMFGVSALVLGFISAGRALELKMRGDASKEVRHLLELQPSVAHVEVDGHEIDVPIEDLQPEAVMLVRPGERIAVDGVLLEGRGAVDEKLLTGESAPVDKRTGDHVLGGSINRGGALKVRVTNVGGTSALGRIVALLADAQTAPPARRRIADVLSTWFVPLIMVIAGLAFLGWYALGGQALPLAVGASIAVLLVGCPSALGLASPTALRVGVAKGAEQGILVKDAEVLERVRKVDMVVFDKTGTLTRGEPELTDLRAFHGSDAELLALAASAEASSEHPLGKTLVRAAEDRGLRLAKASKVQVWPGVGIEALVEDAEVVVGNARLLADRRVDAKAADALVDQLTAEGKTVVLVAHEGTLRGVLAFADPIRPEAREAVEALRAQGADVALVTGDNARTATAVAKQLGIRRIFAEITPHGKRGAVQALQEGGHVVAMVGDGINDAPALKAADVGIAIGAGAELALGAADLVLLKNDPRDVPAAMRLGETTSAKVRQNLHWALGYNLLLVPLAAFGLLDPILAGVAMAFGTLPVLWNSRRMEREGDAGLPALPAKPA